MKVVARTKVEKLIEGTKGHFFGVTFTKKDGSKRVMNARLGVKRYLKGGRNNVVRDDNNYITVWDTHAKGYRTVNLATVKEVSLNGERYKVVD